MGSRTVSKAACTTRSRVVGTVPSYCDPFRVVCGFDIFGQLVGAGDAGMTGCLELRGEVDPAAAGPAAAGRQVAAAGPVVDDVGLDGEPVGDLGDGQLAGPAVDADGVAVHVWADREPGPAGRLDLGWERDAPAAGGAAAAGQLAAGQPGVQPALRLPDRLPGPAPVSYTHLTL